MANEAPLGSARPGPSKPGNDLNRRFPAGFRAIGRASEPRSHTRPARPRPARARGSICRLRPRPLPRVLLGAQPSAPSTARSATASRAHDTEHSAHHGSLPPRVQDHHDGWRS